MHILKRTVYSGQAKKENGVPNDDVEENGGIKVGNTNGDGVEDKDIIVEDIVWLEEAIVLIVINNNTVSTYIEIIVV